MAALLSLTAFRLTPPGCRTRRPGAAFAVFWANGVTDQGLGEATNEVRNEAGNPVLAEVPFTTPPPTIPYHDH